MTSKEYYEKIIARLELLERDIQYIIKTIDKIGDYVEDIAIHTGYDKYVIDYIKGNISNGEED